MRVPKSCYDAAGQDGSARQSGMMYAARYHKDVIVQHRHFVLQMHEYAADWREKKTSRISTLQVIACHER
jgi:hypothetical protein